MATVVPYGARAERERLPIHLGAQPLTIEAAIDHLVEAGQGIVKSELELAKLEAQVTASRLAKGIALMLVGVFLLGGGAVALAMAGYHAFPPDVTPVARLALIAGACALLGTGLALFGMQRMRAHERD
jgi:hypothetical protein